MSLLLVEAGLLESEEHEFQVSSDGAGISFRTMRIV
jgi:hypothetical protein